MGLIHDFATGFSDRNREKKYRLFVETFELDMSTRVLDVGVESTEYQANSNILEKRYPYPASITALGIGDLSEFQKKYPEVRAVTYDGRDFPFPDQHFDVCWSNAVIEHVGDREAQVHFLNEIRRTSRRAFVTTPNRYFPVEVHTKVPFLHFLPKKVFDRFLDVIGKSWAAGEYMHLLGFRDVKKILARCHISDYRIMRNRICGLSIDFVIVV